MAVRFLWPLPKRVYRSPNLGVYAAKNGAPVGNLQRIVKADGTELRAGGSGAAPASAGSGSAKP
jgi:hypothetical protein